MAGDVPGLCLISASLRWPFIDIFAAQAWGVGPSLPVLCIFSYNFSLSLPAKLILWLLVGRDGALHRYFPSVGAEASCAVACCSGWGPRAPHSCVEVGPSQCQTWSHVCLMPKHVVLLASFGSKTPE